MSTSQNFPTISPSLSLDFANVQALDPRITYTRASTATYYGTRTALAEQNLFVYSQEFNNAVWIVDGITLSANNTAAPDGTTTAELFTPTAVNQAHYLYNASNNSPVQANTTYTLSVFAKANGYNHVTVSLAGFNSTVYAAATFDLSAVTVSKTGVGSAGGTLTSSSITSVGNGWFRLVITGSVTQSAGYNLFCVNSNGNPTYGNYGLETFTGDGTSGLFLWGAQLEQRSAVTAYTVTTTQPITNYIPVLESAASGVARFDHNPTTFESLGFLIEEQRTNLINYSEQFDNAYWTKQEVTILANQAIAPDGTLTGDKLIINATTATHQLYKLSVVASSVCATSIYAKADGVNTFQILDGAGGANGATFNLSSGTVTSVGTGSGVIQSVGNGWYRCISIATTTGFRIYCPTASSVETGNGYSGIFIWGAQLEAGAFATSYIPTVASQVTRAADAASMTGTNFSSWYNAAQGTLYLEAIPTNISSTAQTAFAITNIAATTNLVGTAMGQNAGGSGGQSTSLWVREDNANQTFLYTANNVLNVGVPYKVAGTYQFNNFAQSTNSATPLTDTSGIVPKNMDRMLIGKFISSSEFSTHIKKFAYYPLQLTTAQLQAITG